MGAWQCLAHTSHPRDYHLWLHTRIAMLALEQNAGNTDDQNSATRTVVQWRAWQKQQQQQRRGRAWGRRRLQWWHIQRPPVCAGPRPAPLTQPPGPDWRPTSAPVRSRTRTQRERERDIYIHKQTYTDSRMYTTWHGSERSRTQALGSCAHTLTHARTHIQTYTYTLIHRPT
jgi:hypothetical protein